MRTWGASWSLWTSPRSGPSHSPRRPRWGQSQHPQTPPASGPFLRSGNGVLSSFSRPHPWQRLHTRVGEGWAGEERLSQGPWDPPIRSYSPPSPQVSVVEVSVPPLDFLQQPLPGFCHRPLARCTRMGGSQRLLLAPPNLESHSPPSPLVSCCPATFLEGTGRLLCGPLQSSLQTKAHPHLQGGVLRACQMGAVRAISSWLVPYTRMSVLQAPNPPGCLLPSLVSLAFRGGEAGRFFPSAGSQHCRCWRLAGDSAQRLLTVPPSLSPPCPRSDAPSPMR